MGGGVDGHAPNGIGKSSPQTAPVSNGGSNPPLVDATTLSRYQSLPALQSNPPQFNKLGEEHGREDSQIFGRGARRCV
jgi:hypothetical protein